MTVALWHAGNAAKRGGRQEDQYSSSRTLFRERIPIDTSSSMGASRQEADQRRGYQAWWLILVTGILMQIWFWLRSVWIYLDQVDLYRLGMVFVRDGDLLPFGKLSTGGFPIPGVVLELLVGLPLTLWLDLRSSTLVLVFFHLAAVLILSRVLSKDFGWGFAAVYLAILWLSPWRLFHSAFLWETNYLILPAALHLAACRSLRTQGELGASALLAATLLLSIQMHGSALILILATGILLSRQRNFDPLGRFRPRFRAGFDHPDSDPPGMVRRHRPAG